MYLRDKSMSFLFIAVKGKMYILWNIVNIRSKIQVNV